MEIKIHQLLFTLTILGVLAFSSCTKTSVDTAISNKPVVVGYLIPGQPISVKIYQQKDLTDTATYGAAIKGLALTLSDGNKTVSLTESAAGTYTYADNSFLVTGKTYTLQFTYLSTQVSAQTVMPEKPQNYTATKTTINLPTGTSSSISDSVATTFRWSNPDSAYHIIAFKNDDTAPFQINSRGNPPVNFTVNVNKTIEYQMLYRSFNYIGIYRAILLSVDKEYIDLLNNQSGSSSQNLANIPTNVNNGLGIFTAMQADTIKLTLTQY